MFLIFLKMSTQQFDISNLEKTSGIKFNNPLLIQNAFVHRSYLNEHKNYKGDSNERLEFLGDSVLSLAVSEFLYKKLPDHPEGKLTQIRAALVRTETLGKLARKLALGKYLFLSKGEEESGGRTNSSILADTFEALVGAIYQDQGFETAKKFLSKIVLSDWQVLIKSAVSDNKSKLQEVLQREYRQSPSYKLLKSWGPDHARQFEIGVYLGNKILGKGIGKSKQEAAQNAAAAAMGGLAA